MAAAESGATSSHAPVMSEEVAAHDIGFLPSKSAASGKILAGLLKAARAVDDTCDVCAFTSALSPVMKLYYMDAFTSTGPYSPSVVVAGAGVATGTAVSGIRSGTVRPFPGFLHLDIYNFGSDKLQHQTVHVLPHRRLPRTSPVVFVYLHIYR